MIIIPFLRKQLTFVDHVLLDVNVREVMEVVDVCN
jgi:hypothetical protein